MSTTEEKEQAVAEDEQEKGSDEQCPISFSAG